METNNSASINEDNADLKKLLLETQKVKQEVEKLNTHKLVKASNTLSGMMYFFFLKGIAFGFGTVVGATLVVSLLAYFLSFFELVPIIGDWVGRIVDQVQK